MKHTLIVLALATAFFSANATVVIKNSNVTDVTIYRSYAKETRLGSATIPSGNSEVVITNITTSIDENSIQVGCKNNVKILSVSSRLNYLSEDKNLNQGKIKTWQDSIKALDKKSRYISKQKEGYEVELSVLNTNNKLGSEKDGLKPELLKELLELNRVKQAELKKLIFDADEESAEIRNVLTLLQNQVNESSSKLQGKAVREIVLKVNSSADMNTQFKVSYLVTTASWTPTYEIRCENTTQPLQLNCRAKIVQSTGFDWKEAHLKLSTANPNQNHDRPILYPIYVDFMQPGYYQHQLESSNSFSKYRSGMEAKMPAAPMQVQMMKSNMAYAEDNEFKNGMKLEENMVTVAEGDLMMEYDIEQKQDIESDGQEHIISIQELSLPAQYNYHTVPKLDNGVFLLARITDWGKYNLLAGDATLFFDDMYVGKSYINPNVSADTLLISLGRDEKINVKRVKLNELCVTKKFSSKKKETKAYETIVKNNKNTAVDIEVLDQYPIAKNTEIEVTLDEAEGAQVTKEYGKLLWRIKLQPGESMKLKTIYTVKFPEERMVSEKN